MLVLALATTISCRTTEKAVELAFSSSPLNEKGFELVATSDRNDEADVAMQLQVRRRNGWRFVSNGGDVESGDRVRLVVELQRRHHVHVFYEARGEAIPLFPQEGERSSLHAGIHAIPTRDAPSTGLRLDDDPGRETLYLVASRQPLRRADDELAARLGRQRSTRDVVTDLEALRLKSKGGDGTTRSDGSTIYGQAGDDGIVVLTIEVNHVD